MYTYTIICFGAEIAFGEGVSFEAARRDAISNVDSSPWYPESDWGYISKAPNGMRVSYNI